MSEFLWQLSRACEYHGHNATGPRKLFFNRCRRRHCSRHVVIIITLVACRVRSWSRSLTVISTHVIALNQGCTIQPLLLELWPKLCPQSNAFDVVSGVWIMNSCILKVSLLFSRYRGWKNWSLPWLVNIASSERQKEMLNVGAVASCVQFENCDQICRMNELDNNMIVINIIIIWN